jgi:pSer/pThr/pTyr-binding forkhead associated (FHA) protein
MFKADGSRRDFSMTKDRMIVGRTSGCDLRIPLTSVSRQHCELRIEDGKIYLRDLGSSNGTYHNSIRVQETMLKAGDEVVIGPVNFTLVVDNYPEHIEPVRTVVDMTVETKPRTDAPTEPAKPQSFLEHDNILPTVEDEAKSPTAELDDPLAALQSLTRLQNIEEGESTTDALTNFEDDFDENAKK